MLNQIKNGFKNIRSKMRPPKITKAGQKSLEEREKMSAKNSHAVQDSMTEDPAHGEGNKKLNVDKLAKKKAHGKNKPMNASAQNNLRPADVIKKNQSAQRRSGPIGRGNK